MIDLTTVGGLQAVVGVEGQIAYLITPDVENYINESANGIDFGRAVARGAVVSDPQHFTCKPVAADADVIIGMSVLQHANAANIALPGGVPLYTKGSAVPVMKMGYLFVIPFENVVVGDPVISITAQAGKLGGVSGGAAGAGRVLVPNAKFETTTLAGSVGLVRINVA